MGLPSINLEFGRRARTLIERSERGIVLMLVNDSTKADKINGYTSFSDVSKVDYTADNYLNIRLAFMGGISKLIVVRGIAGDEGRINIEESLKLINHLVYDWFCYPECNASEGTKLAKYFDEGKTKQFKKAKAVLPNTLADSMAVVNFVGSDISILIDGELEEVEASRYACRIAGLLAGTSLEASATYAVLPELVDIKLSESPDKDVDAGKFIVIFDGEKFKVARAVTSLTSITLDKSKDYKKIKIVEASDIIRTDILRVFEDVYVGKYNNTYDNKQLFVGAIKEYLKSLEDILIEKDNFDIYLDTEAIRAYLKNEKKLDVSDMDKLAIDKSNTDSHLFVAGHIRFIDAMEDLSFKIEI